MTFVQRHKLISTIESLKHDTQNVISWSCEIPDDLFITSFDVKNVGNVTIPVSKKDIKILEDNGERFQINNWQVEWHIKGSEIAAISPSKFSTSVFPQLISSVLANFKESCIPFENIETNLSHIALMRPLEAADDIVYEDDGPPVIKHNVKNRNYPGSFATLILQIPVVGGRKGGDFRLNQGNCFGDTFTTSRNSQRSFHVTLYYDDCQVVTEPLVRGYRLELVYTIQHKNVDNGIERPLEDDSCSPLYRIWQAVSELPLETKSQLSKKHSQLIELLSCWKQVNHSRVELYAIPLDHTYCKNSLSFTTLKGIDRLTADIIALLGDFVEIHLATITKYVGFKEEDWLSSGREYMIRKGIKHLEAIREKEWTEHWAGNWVDLRNRRLLLPPIRINVPDELLGIDEVAFQGDASELSHDGKFDGHTFDRAALIVWPRNQTFSTALCFGLDQALDVAEHGSKDDLLGILESKKTQIKLLLAFCRQQPNRSWFASTSSCEDLRCDRARPVSIEVARKRVSRMIKLCLHWDLPDCGLELLRLLSSSLESDFYRCHNCTVFGESAVFVGGICSKDVAFSLAELIVTLGWESNGVKDYVTQLCASIVKFDVKQSAHLAQLAMCLFHRQLFDAAFCLCDQAYHILDQFYFEQVTESSSTDTAIGSCIDMLFLFDGPFFCNESRLSKLLVKLQSVGAKYSSFVVGWLQQSDPAALKSLPSYWSFYMELVTGLESLLAAFDSSSDITMPLSTRLEYAVAQLMAVYLRSQDQHMLRRLTDKITFSKKPESRKLLAAVISSRNLWCDSSQLGHITLACLSAARVQQLVRYKFPLFKWEQPDAVLKNYPAVEAFLHSADESMIIDSFANEMEAKTFAETYFGSFNHVSGYSATVKEIGCNPDNVAYVKISKTLDIYEASMKELMSLEAMLVAQNVTTSPVKSEGGEIASMEVSTTPTGDFPQPSLPSSAKRPRGRLARSNSAPITPTLPKKKSKRLSGIGAEEISLDRHL